MNSSAHDSKSQGLATEALLIITGIAILGALAYVATVARRDNSADNSTLSQAQNALIGSRPSAKQLAEALADAQAKLSKQSTLLAAMRNGFPSSPELDSQVNTEYAAAAATIAQTDTFFNNPNSANPTLKLASSDPAAAAEIEALRAELNADIAAWKSASLQNNSTLLLSQAALQDMNEMQSYMNQLTSYFNNVNSSTPLQSDIILAYQNQLAAESQTVNNSISSVSSIGGPVDLSDTSTDSNSNTSNSSTNSPAGNSSNNSSNTNSSASNNSNADTSSNNSSSNSTSNSSSNSSSNTSNETTVTVTDVVDQENQVDDTNQEINDINQQIADQNSSDDSSVSDSNTNSDSVDNSNSDDSNDNSSVDNSDSNDNSDNSDNSGDSGYTGSYLPLANPNQNGPQLIQGSNPFSTP